MHDPILVSVDLSESTRDVLLFAGEMANVRNRPLIVLHVVNGSVPDAVQRNGAKVLHPSLPNVDAAHEHLDALLEDLAGHHPHLTALREARTVLVTGLPAGRIVEVAVREEVGMIIMGSHGRQGVSRMMNGSVAESVARRSPVPVTVVKDGKAVE